MKHLFLLLALFTLVLTSLLLGCESPDGANTDPNFTPTNGDPNLSKKVVQTYIDAYNAKDLEKAKSLLTDDFVRYSSSSTTWAPLGKEEWADMWASFSVAFPDFNWKVVSMAVNGDTVAIEVVETATFTGTWVLPNGKKIKPTGKGYESHMALLFQVNQDGLIQNYRQYVGVAFLQIGLKLADILAIAASGL